MNQKEIKSLIFLCMLPVIISYGAIVGLIRTIDYLSGISPSINLKKLENSYISKSLNMDDGDILFVIPFVLIGAFAISKSEILSFWGGVFVILIAILCIYLLYQAYAYFYFVGNKFISTKNSIKDHTRNCNELNIHINELFLANLNFSSFDYGNASLDDSSSFNFKRREWSKIDNAVNIHNCSSSVVKNAMNQPFKYFCKYFDVEVNEKTLSAIEDSLNDILSAEQGRILLEKERDRIISEMSQPVPSLLLRFSRERVMRNLGFDPIPLNRVNFPTYIFRYVSPGGNSSYDCTIELDIENIEKLIIYLGEIIKFRRTVKGQRAIMTKELREKIKRRDKYTCKKCGLSSMSEKNLLLEIDHIIPLSKGGVTSEDNLQTLCWKCNRSKGAKILQS